MATLKESLAAPTPLGSDLQAGVDQLSLQQQVTFTKYKRLVLPIDGFVFWLNTGLLNQRSARYNEAEINAVRYDQLPPLPRAPATCVAKGSLHYMTETRQDETSTYAVNTVIFTSEQEVAELNSTAPDELWIATFDGVRFSFSRRNSFYKQADLWHYQGQAVFADMRTQVIDSLAGFSGRQVVSNSLPAWLALQNYSSVFGFGPLQFPLFPSYLVPDNISPPFASVHVDPAGTRAIASTLAVGSDLSLSQLAADRVTVTLFGVRNDQALDFVAAVNQYSLDTDVIGIMNMPVVRDEKRPQPELMAISMKKVVDFEVSYYQRRMNDVARQLILEAVPNFYLSEIV